MYLRSENARSDEYRHWRRRGMPRIGQLAGTVSENANYLHTPTLAKQGSHSLPPVGLRRKPEPCDRNEDLKLDLISANKKLGLMTFTLSKFRIYLYQM